MSRKKVETKTAWDKANEKAKELFGEFGLATCTEEQIGKIVNLELANKYAEDMYGEFGFGTCLEGEMEELINANPEVLL